ncbi:MAG: ATPase, T2SS/T4P/T4SS family [bacterium]|nr:ATPase, T2SS/T4P/T4SS family [bacterium]
MRIDPQQLKSFLIDSSLIKAEQFDEAAKVSRETNQRLGDVLVCRGFISQEELAKLQAYILGIPFINLAGEKLDPETLRIIPEPIARTHNIVAIKKKGNTLEVAMLDPDDLGTIEFIKKQANLKILPRLTTVESIKNAIKQYRQSLEAEFGEIIARQTKSVEPGVFGEKDKEFISAIRQESQTVKEDDLEKVAQDMPIIKIVDTLLKHAILQRASDIHIEPFEKEILVRYRIDGILREAMTLPKNVLSGIVARIKVLSNLKLDEHRLPQDGRFKVETEDFKYSIRVSILPVFDGEKVVMRLLAENTKALTLEDLGLWGEVLEKVRVSLRRPVGILLVTGPTGCGKTTTIYAMMEILNSPEVNISTVEDPVEYRIPHANQTQVNPKIGLTFASGLRSLVRQDPDIIMVGEIRDEETAGLAINAALTGHLVLSTIHTNSAAGAIPRLIDMKVEPFLISSTVNLILAQRLVRKLADDKTAYRLKDAELDSLRKYCDLDKMLRVLKEEKVVPKSADWKDIDFFRPKPSKDNLDGYRSRLGIFEVLTASQTIKELITSQATADHIQQQAQKEGMMTMIEDGFIKAVRGQTSLEEVLRVIGE